jgi:hypothetical protein
MRSQESQGSIVTMREKVKRGFMLSIIEGVELVGLPKEQGFGFLQGILYHKRIRIEKIKT